MAVKPVKIRGRVKNGVANVKCLMPHPMETGTRRNDDGALIPANYIENVTCLHNGNQVMSAQWGPSVSKDPFLAFKVKNAAAGERVTVQWTDNLGQSSSGELVLK